MVDLFINILWLIVVLGLGYLNFISTRSFLKEREMWHRYTQSLLQRVGVPVYIPQTTSGVQPPEPDDGLKRLYDEETGITLVETGEIV